MTRLSDASLYRPVQWPQADCWESRGETMTDWIFWGATFILLVVCMAMWEYIVKLKEDFAASHGPEIMDRTVVVDEQA